MGLFDKVFEKKYCDVCGSEIKLLGNRKLADGNLCKNCAAKLSPWFSDRRVSTVEDIKKQLAYREENAKALTNFHPAVIIGGKTKVYVDEKTEQFIVTGASPWRASNPDLISLKQVKSAEWNVDEDKEELYQTVDGKRVSYEPKKYEVTYRFYMKLGIDSPYFDEIRFELTEGNKVTGRISQEYKNLQAMGKKIQEALMPSVYGKKEETPKAASVKTEEVKKPSVFVDARKKTETKWICPSCGAENEGAFCSNCGAAKKIHWFCPNCGKENEGNFCVGCGTKKPE